MTLDVELSLHDDAGAAPPVQPVNMAELGAQALPHTHKRETAHAYEVT
ncbi:hypothetical protein [Streptomyces cadmiisoli]